MKIVHFVPWLVKGGGERAAVDLANWQIGQGHDVTIVSGIKVDERLLRNDIDERANVIFVVERPSRGMLYLRGLAWLWRNRQWLRACDVLHAHMSFPAFLLTVFYFYRLLMREWKPLIVETYHAVGVYIPGFDRACHAWMARRRDALVLMAEDPFWRAFAQRHDHQIIRFIPNGLEPPRCRRRQDPEPIAYARQHQIPSGCELIGTIGRFVPERRPELYVPLFARIARRHGQTVHFVMIGSGPQLEEVRELARRAHVADRISFPGLALDPSIPLALCDIYVTIGVGAVVGLAAVHAALCGIPVVAIQLVHGYTATSTDWVWSHANPDKVAERILELLAHPERRVKLASAQQLYARENLTVGKMGAAYERVYEQARHALLK